LLALVELPAEPFVVRVSETPPTDSVVVALIVVVPAVGELIVIVHEPVPPTVLHELGPTNVAVAPPAFVSEKLIVVPGGAFTYPLPSPRFTFTCPVSTWFVPTGFSADGGVISMFASTQVFAAGPESGAVPSVCTVNAADPPTESVDEALQVSVPAVDEFTVAVK
jgi:hypothetical protein